MSDKKTATSDVKSGGDNKKYASTVLGGFPPEKSVEEINKVNSVKKAPASTSS